MKTTTIAVTYPTAETMKNVLAQSTANNGAVHGMATGYVLNANGLAVATLYLTRLLLTREGEPKKVRLVVETMPVVTGTENTARRPLVADFGAADWKAAVEGALADAGILTPRINDQRQIIALNERVRELASDMSAARRGVDEEQVRLRMVRAVALLDEVQNILADARTFVTQYNEYE